MWGCPTNEAGASVKAAEGVGGSKVWKTRGGARGWGRLLVEMGGVDGCGAASCAGS